MRQKTNIQLNWKRPKTIIQINDFDIVWWFFGEEIIASFPVISDAIYLLLGLPRNQPKSKENSRKKSKGNRKIAKPSKMLKHSGNGKKKSLFCSNIQSSAKLLYGNIHASLAKKY
jgi:hypothetical protein